MTASATTSRRDNRHARTPGGPGCGSASVRGDSAAPERRRTMSRNAIRAVSVLVLALAASWNPTPAGAGTTGKLAGRVTNDKKEPLAGVNIRVEGQRLGAVSDDKGEYFILSVPGGSYTVRAN